MKLIKTELSRSETDKNNTVLTGVITYQNFSAEEKIWFEVPDTFAEELSTSGNPWLVFMLPLAAHFNEPIRLSLPVDRTLLDNSRTLLNIWHSWWPDWHIPSIETDITGVLSDSEKGSRIGAAFSGGVDSFFTILSHESDIQSRVDDLLSVWGFDVPLAKTGEFDKMHINLAAAAKEMNKEFIVLKTNLRETNFSKLDWERSFGAALSTVALVLEKRFKLFYIGSPGLFKMESWGSSPMTDHFFSSSQLQFIHDGATTTRAQKTQFISDSPIIQRALRVCWIKKSSGNCSECIKCYRTMATLAAFGKLEKFKTFDNKKFTLERLAKMVFLSDWDNDFFLEIKEMAQENGYEELAEKITQSMKYSKRRKNVLSFLDKLSNLPFCWRITTYLKENYSKDFIS